MSHNYYPHRPAWRSGELNTSDYQRLREELEVVPHLTGAFGNLGHGLGVGSSRTVYHLAINQFYRDALEAMVGAAYAAAEVICQEGVEAELRGTPLQVRVDELPEQFQITDLPRRTKAAMSPDTPVGYIRAENTEAGLRVSVGALDPQTQTHYAVPLS